ncbi:Dor1-domain-containing protein [Cutaneotrichosporon oleaginosum]|uniref:Conserved oligomeric Golgi complex subunit 8 n=1 Tax=Cutaneotrichosporon oleaginosum TaxID=879819 RepID=A0A0J0XIX6_9TREE|nr:Dor1-domain-containing protein [Cutaneotrichosporon oleaginosum]KLT41013.1 Dor1-domain-containing protein [Cutaneotrichosporon oleaginosum]TXT12106.1 hypothetical protein COLE_02516 [Cutaneotrichosporon oleaginosum]
MEEEPDTPSLVDLLQHTAASQHLPVPDLRASAAQEYLDTLQSLPLKALLAEAGAIAEAAGGVEGELTNLCYREYTTFISVHKCSAAVTSAFDDFSSSLGRLLDAVPALEDECRTFVRSTAGVQEARAKAALVQEHQDKLFDLLEIPQLMDTCVRNGYYQEALELSAHTTSLVKRYPAVELVQDVAKEVDGVLQLMLAQLLALLREPIKLPALVKTVGYLRRLHIIGENELGLAFLVSRLSNFRTQLGALERDRPDPVRYVRKYVDLFREHVFDIISQFSAIFDGQDGAAQLASFVGQCVDELVDVVASNVPNMNDAASLSSILVQLGYCALAFARVGLDFSSLVTDPFADAVTSAFNGAVADATKSLTATLAQAEKGSNSPSSALLAPEALPALLSADTPFSFIPWSGSLEALPDLAKFSPLAILVNAHLSALNSLRLLAPLHLHPALAATQCAALTKCTHAVAQYVRQAVAVSDPMNPGGGHKQSGSGRAQLIRRNSETQLTPEARAARRREAQRTCVAFADAWAHAVVPLLRAALDTGVFEEALDDSAELLETLETLDAWVRDQQDEGAESPVKEAARTPNGSGAVTPMAVHDEAVDEPEEMAMEERAASPVRTPSPVKAARSPSPLKAASLARSPSPVNGTTLPRMASPVNERSASPPKERSPSPVKAPSPIAAPSPEAARAPSPVKASSPVRGPSPVKAPSPVRAPSPEKVPSPTPSPSPVKAASPVKSPSPVRAPSPVSSGQQRSPSPAKAPSPARSPSPKPLPQFAIDTPSAAPTPAASATPAPLATPAVETPARVVTPEPAAQEVLAPETGADAATEQPKQLETRTAEMEVPSVDAAAPPPIAEDAVTTHVPLNSKPEPVAAPAPVGSNGDAETSQRSPVTDAIASASVISASDAEPTVATSSLTPEKTSDIVATPTPADVRAPPSIAAASAEPDAKAETAPAPSAPETLVPPPVSAFETPVEEADDDPAESTEPSRPPSPTAAAPSTSGGGKKKKKNKKKKK